MRKLILVAVAVSICLTGMAMALSPKLPKSPVAIDDLYFAQEGMDIIAKSSSNPSVFSQFEHPVVCGPYEDPGYNNGKFPICNTSNVAVFMDKGGKVRQWEKGIGGTDDVFNYARGQRISRSAPAYYIAETPEGVSYCIYENEESPTCELFPGGEDIRADDQFIACSVGPKYWAVDNKTGTFYDCGKPSTSQAYPGKTLYSGRIARFVVKNIEPDGKVFLRCAERYDPVVGLSLNMPITEQLNKNGRLRMMGNDSNIFMLVKMKNPKAAKATTPKTKKK